VDRAAVDGDLVVEPVRHPAVRRGTALLDGLEGHTVQMGGIGPAGGVQYGPTLDSGEAAGTDHFNAHGAPQP